MPCVSTSLGAEGLNVTNEKDILIADTSEAFARAVIDLLKNPKKAAALGKSLKKRVSSDYGLHIQENEARLILDYL